VVEVEELLFQGHPEVVDADLADCEGFLVRRRSRILDAATEKVENMHDISDTKDVGLTME
jgi:hypothetical protein